MLKLDVEDAMLAEGLGRDLAVAAVGSVSLDFPLLVLAAVPEVDTFFPSSDLAMSLYTGK